MSKATQAIDLVDSLLKISTIRINNIPKTTEKLEKILQDGRKNLHFICDFDMTMSRYWVRNKETFALERNTNSHGIPAKSKLLPQEYIDETYRLFNIYYPIEFDPTLTVEEKIPYMVKWTADSNETLVRLKLSKKDLAEMVKRVDVKLRPGLEKVLAHCRDNQVPFLVFSAGIGNLIEEILKQADSLFDNMHIVANMMEFDDQDVCTNFKEPLIHTFNKSEFQIETSPYHQLIKERTNVILMGDHLGDLQMSKGVFHEVCLNIGYLNYDVTNLEPSYLEAFDILIEHDANMDPIMEILKYIE